uniref:Knottin scorpion toxin-like domain-containing protein n=1 Tax=Oryza brachyantha TaxID=4533 RepID=J3N6J2_ORYBR
MTLPSTHKVVAVASLTAALLAAMASPPAATGQPLPGRCGDLGLPQPCSADECQHECGGMGGDPGGAHRNLAGACC